MSNKKNILDVFLAIESELRRYLLRFLLSKEDIDDVLQDAFIRVYKDDVSANIQSPRRFLFTVVRNLALTEINREVKKTARYIEDFDIEEVIDDRSCPERNETIRRELLACRNAIKSLPTKCQRVFVMRKVYGFSHKEIARTLDITVSTVEKQLIKGLKRYEEYLNSGGSLRADEGRSQTAKAESKAPALPGLATRGGHDK